MVQITEDWWVPSLQEPSKWYSCDSLRDKTVTKSRECVHWTRDKVCNTHTHICCKCVLWDLPYLTGRDVHLLRTQICCSLPTVREWSVDTPFTIGDKNWLMRSSKEAEIEREIKNVKTILFWRWLSSGMLHRLFSKKLADVSVVLTDGYLHTSCSNLKYHNFNLPKQWRWQHWKLWSM
jgi:hypothetical protein